MQVKLVTIKKWCALTGAKPSMVYSYRTRGLWRDGRETEKANNGKIWVNIQKAEEWLRGNVHA